MFYGLVSYRVNEFVELYRSRAEAEKAADEVLRDAPELRGVIGVLPLRFEFSLN